MEGPGPSSGTGEEPTGSRRRIMRAMGSVGRLALALASVAALSGCFPRSAGPRLAHFADQAPAVGRPAPDVSLEAPDGTRIRLSELWRERPVVLQLGSHTCPVFRYRRFGMEELWEEWHDRVHFVVVYTREAHPVEDPSPYAEGEWDLWINRLTGVRLSEPESYEARRARARFSHERLDLPIPFVVDGMDDAVWRLFGAAPSAAFVISPEGTVAAAQAWVRPAELDRVLAGLLRGADGGRRGDGSAAGGRVEPGEERGARRGGS